jgi:ribosomal RNA methyltransferase Nop2
VAKFHKIGPTPANLVRDKIESAPRQLEEVIDKTPIQADDKVRSQTGEDDGFGGFDDDEDAEYMQRAKRNAMRKRGLDPKSLEKPKAQDKAKTDTPQVKEVKAKAKPTNGGKSKTKSKA